MREWRASLQYPGPRRAFVRQPDAHLADTYVIYLQRFCCPVAFQNLKTLDRGAFARKQTTLIVESICMFPRARRLHIN